jgi:DNA-binding winged helix-turn-helix (wHTH) protein/Tol biopolymer transport system component
MDSLSGGQRIAFGDYVLDTGSRVLTRDGELVRLPAKVVDTLVVLVQARGEVVSKEALLAQVWPTTIVEESGLQRNISLLRKELSQGGEDFIETVPKRGYRFRGELKQAAQVAESRSDPAPDLPPASEAREIPARRPHWLPWLGASLLVIGLLGASGAYLARHSPRDAPAPQAARVTPQKQPPGALAGEVSQVTRNSAELSVVAAAISPDGQWFAYDERASLRLRNVATGDVTELHTPPGVQTAYLTWDASGENLLLSGLALETRISELWRVPRSGAPPRKLVDDATMAAASPSGDRIAFNRGEYELWTMAADGTAAELFYETPPNRRMLFRPAFSRDGKRIYVLLFGRAEHVLHLEVYDIHSKQRLFSAPTDFVQDFALLDDNTMLASMATTTGVFRGVYLATLALDFERQRVVETSRLQDWPYYRVYEISATADGRTAVFVRDQTQSDIYVADLAPDGGSLTHARRLTLDDGADRVTGWLADNRTVLFHAQRESLGIYAQQLDAKRATRLPDDGRPAWLPVSTHDGRWLLYMAFAPGGFPSPDHPQTLMRRSLTQPAAAQPLLTSGDGIGAVNCARRAPRCIFVEGQEGKTTFAELDVDSGRLRKLFTLPLRFEAGFNWAVSPDGRSVAYVERASSGMRVAVRDLDSLGSMRTSLPVEGNGLLRSVQWDADGTGLFAVQCVGEPGVLLHLDLNSRVRVLRRVHTGCDGWAIPSPDGKRLAFIEWTSTGNLWVLRR